MSGLSVIKRSANSVPRWPFTMARQSEQARGLVAWYPGAQIGMGNAIVNMANPQQGTAIVNGTCAFTGGPIDGLAIETPGTSGNYLNGGTDISFDGDNWTIHLWFQPKSAGTYQRFISYYGPTLWTEGGASWAIVHLGSIDFSLPSSVFVFNSWYFATITRSGSNIAAYKDGALIQSSGSFAVSYSKNDSIYIGRGEFDEPSHAIYRDVRLYNRALSAPEVWALYDPATRYELYQPVHSRNDFKAAAANLTRTSDFNISIGAV